VNKIESSTENPGAVAVDRAGRMKSGDLVTRNVIKHEFLDWDVPQEVKATFILSSEAPR